MGPKRKDTAAGKTSDSDSDSDGERRRVAAKPRPKRRRILDPSAITAVQIYSNKVDSDLKLQPLPFEPVAVADVEDTPPQAGVTRRSPRRAAECVEQGECIELSDSEEEGNPSHTPIFRRSPSPPPSPSTPLRARRAPNRKLLEINRRLDAIGSLLSLSPERAGLVPAPDQSLDEGEESDDVDIAIVDTPTPRCRVRRPRPPEPEQNQQARQISLKIRYRDQIHRILLPQTAPLKRAVEELSVKLKAPPSSLLLLHKETEIPMSSTISELGLGIADIIDCVVLSKEVREDDDGCRGDGCRESEGQQGSDVITVRLQGKEKGSQQEYSVRKREPLGSVLTRYTSQLPPSLRHKTRFMFDGSKVCPAHTPLDLDMEDGDVIEVWC